MDRTDRDRGRDRDRDREVICKQQTAAFNNVILTVNIGDGDGGGSRDTKLDGEGAHKRREAVHSQIKWETTGAAANWHRHRNGKAAFSWLRQPSRTCSNSSFETFSGTERSSASSSESESEESESEAAFASVFVLFLAAESSPFALALGDCEVAAVAASEVLSSDSSGALRFPGITGFVDMIGWCVK